MVRYVDCTRCGKPNEAAYREQRANTQMRWHKCPDPCRHHYRTLHDADGSNPVIICQSPKEQTQNRAPLPTAAQLFNMSCPTCGNYGKVRMTEMRDDGYYRRHKCVTCGPYFSRTNDDGVSVLRKMPSKLAIEI